jgi:hypothetical protein
MIGLLLLLAAQDESGVGTLLVENDALGSKDDRNYTAGVKAVLRLPARLTPGFARDLGACLAGAEASVTTTWGLGQSVFTPEDKTSTGPVPGQHPYAGWLYGELGIHADDGAALTSLTLSLGVVGPAALGQEMQDWFHQATAQPLFAGWANQLPDEPALLLSLERRWRVPLGALGDVEADLLPLAGLSLGNVLVEGEAGCFVRAGRALDRDYGPVRIRPGNAGPGPVPRAEPLFAWRVWAGVHARVQAWNLFLDGSTWETSLSVARKAGVVDLEVGAAVELGFAVLSYTFVVRTTEFVGGGDGQRFGAVSISVRF